MGASVIQMRAAEREEAETCCNCGVEFASPVLRKRLIDGKSFYCPNGHSQHYTKTTSQKLQEQLDAEILLRQQAQNDAEWQRAEARNARIQEIKAKNALKKIQVRVSSGVCTKCNRTFKQLAAHMKCKHGAE